MLAFQRVGQGLQRPVALCLDGIDAAAVVEEAIYGFLKHALLIAKDHLGCLNLQQTLQTVVAYNDATIQIVEV